MTRFQGYLWPAGDVEGAVRGIVGKWKGFVPVQLGEWVVGADTGSQGSIPGAVPLPYQQPGEAERAVLRELYQEHGSKNKALTAAYELGKTPKSLGWLNEALAEMETR